MSTRLFVSLLAGALMVPQVALGDSAASDSFRLPPIPYAETIPWLTGTAPMTKPFYLGLLIAPQPLAETPQLMAAPVLDRLSLRRQFAADKAFRIE
jgi:hypothetical protein